MSIILKGIDMPNKIDLDFHDNHIVLGGVLYPIDIDQLVYIPTPHGDLIDRNTVRDECYKTMEELMQSTTINISAEALSLLCGFTIINNAPTILEAEE